MRESRILRGRAARGGRGRAGGARILEKARPRDLRSGAPAGDLRPGAGRDRAPSLGKESGCLEPDERQMCGGVSTLTDAGGAREVHAPVISELLLCP